MADPVEIHRREVTQRLQLANAQGGWEGTHTDFKRELGSSSRDLGKTLKHILAFTNTPRRTDAYIIFGVDEDKDLQVFQHTGVRDQGFPPQERINDIIHAYSRLRDVVVDTSFVLDGKRTPYIAIPLQYEGPYTLLQSYPGVGDVDDIFCRYGSSSTRATERDVRRMTADWATWFLDCRYEKTPTSLKTILAKRFPRHKSVSEYDGCIRLLYDNKITDALGTHVVPALIHAYWGFDPVGPDAVKKIATDKSQIVYQKTLIGARFDSKTPAAAEAEGVFCVSLDEIYFVDDPYAHLCREFIHKWEKERTERHLAVVLDLDYRLTSPDDRQARQSVLSFLEEQVHGMARSAVVIHGDFGCGKTITAKQFVADLSTDYLRGHGTTPKALYLDVNNLDIRSRREECIESQLMRYELSREHIDRIIAQVRNDEIHLIFDGVDEMARPYTSGGRHDAIQLLRDIGNRRATAYFVRSSYFPELAEMLSEFSALAEHDFSAGKKRIVSAEIQQLRQPQVELYLSSRLGNEDARIVRSGLYKVGLESFLVDPLIVSLVTDLVEKDGTDAVSSFPQKGKKAHFLSYLVHKLLAREQDKRQRHGGLAQNFALFQQVLQTVAFGMVCKGSTIVLPAQLEAFVQRVAADLGSTAEMVESFRTMSWIRRSQDGGLSFRPEALTPVCAAEHVCTALCKRDALALSEWQKEAPLATVLCDYVGEMIDSCGVLGAMAMLGGEVQFNVRQLVRSALDAARSRTDLGAASGFDERMICAICQGIIGDINVGRLAATVLLQTLPPKRVVQVGVPLLFLLAQNSAPEAVNIAVDTLDALWKNGFGERQFYDGLRAIKEDRTSLIDHVLVRELQVSVPELVDGSQYEAIFARMADTDEVRLRQYADRTLRAIHGEQHRRAAAFRDEGRRR